MRRWARRWACCTAHGAKSHHNGFEAPRCDGANDGASQQVSEGRRTKEEEEN
jgi:hypothetical protein